MKLDYFGKGVGMRASKCGGATISRPETRFPPGFVGDAHSHRTNRSDEALWGAVKRACARGAGRIRPRSYGGGFTLLEVSLVLALIVVIAALAVPAFQSTLKHERLRKAAEAIRADWTRTQTRAMMTGETQVWVCMLASGGFATSPYNSDYGLGGTTAADVTNRVSSTTGLTPTQTSAAGGSFGQTLSEGVTIQEVLVSEADSVTSMTQTSSAGEDGMATIFFYPDGSSSSGRITVMNEDGRAISVVLNGVAGTVRVMPVEVTSQ